MTGPGGTPAYQVSRNSIGLWLLEGALAAVPLLIAAVVAALLVPADAATGVRAAAAIAPYVAAGYAVVVVLIRPRLRFHVHRWEIMPDAVYTASGWITRTTTIVPISRIQTVDVTQGALQRIFGLASLAVLTASSRGTIEIVHLADPVARAVSQDLSRRAQAVRDEAT